MRPSTLLLAALAAAALTTTARAQNAKDKDKSKEESDTRVSRISRAGLSRGDRAFLGIGTGWGGKRDTLGLLINSITPNGPAEKAGLEEGDRIAAVNSVSLRLSAADAGEPDMNGLLSRRLTRELSKVKPGDEVELKLWHEGKYRTVKVKTAEQPDAGWGFFRRTSAEQDDRAVVGLGAGGSGSRRDTLGLLITSVEENGPAEKAGIEEGNRLAGINGVDLRVSAEDAGDGAISNAKEQRFVREMRKLKAGDNAELKVYANGQMKTLTVKTARSSDVYKNRPGSRFFIGDGGEFVMPPMPPMPPMPAMAPMAPMTPITPMVMPRVRMYMDADVTGMAERAREMASEMRMQAGELRAVAESARQMAGTARAMAPMAAYYGDIGEMARGAAEIGRRVSGSMFGGGNLMLDGLRLTSVTGDLASYFGAGSENGLLVLDASRHWKGILPGDVILKVNGKSVREEGHSHISLDTDEDNELELLRKGKKLSVKVPAP
ncbi:MAG: PDZ domain-containing protein [Gemmatimonadota bacterium]|nr:PDZ domain-containing protein [Gemmatimonadota bacterium]